MSENYIILQGLPGAGKGTQARLLEKNLPLKHVSCGDVFRDHVRQRTAFGRKAQSHIEAGTLTPDEETNEMFLKYLSELSTTPSLLLEGFPRTLTQLSSFDRFIDENGHSLRAMIQLVVAEEELVSRLMTRRMCPKCGRTYNAEAVRPAFSGRCDVDHETLVQRAEDIDETLIRSRLDTYRKAEQPVVDKFSERGLLVPIPADGGVADVTRKISRELMPLLN